VGLGQEFDPGFEGGWVGGESGGTEDENGQERNESVHEDTWWSGLLRFFLTPLGRSEQLGERELKPGEDFAAVQNTGETESFLSE